MIVVVREMLRRLLNAARNHTASGNFDGPLRGSWVGLFTDAAPGLNVDTLLADLTEADFAGYGKVALTWGPPHVEGDSAYAVATGLSTFAPSDAVTPNVCYGYFVVDSTGPPGLLLFAEMFPQPISMGNAEAYLGIVNQFKVGDPANYGAADLVM